MLKSLARGLQVLQCFSPETPSLRLKDIADQLQIPMGSAFRIVSTLEEMGYLRQELSSKNYRLGLKVLNLGHICLTGMVYPDVALPFLEALASETQQSANMAVLDETEIVFVARASIKRLMSVNLSVGSRLPSYCSSMGKVLLAHLDDGERQQLLSRITFRAYTPYTIIDLATLEEDLRTVRANGYSISDEELERHLKTVAAPIRDGSGKVVAAINVAMFSTRGEAVDEEESTVRKLLQTAQVISSALGYRPGRNATSVETISSLPST